MRSKVDQGNMSPATRLEAALVDNLPGVVTMACRHSGSFIEVRIKQRGPDDWLAIAKRDGDDGAPEVLFAFGIDFIGCVLSLDRMVQAGRWREDRPWVNGTGRG